MSKGYKMLKRLSLAALILLLAGGTLVRAQTVDEVIAKHVAALGGIEKWRGLESLSTVSRSEHFSSNQYWKKTNRIRIEVLLEGPTPGRDVRVFDGTKGWRINPMEGSTDPRLMSDKEVAGLREESDWLKELVDYEAKGHKVKLEGSEELEGKAAYKLKLTKSSGEVIQIFIDAKTFLEMRRVRGHKAPWGEEIVQTIKVGDYRPVGGLLLPHRVGESVREYQVNRPIDDAIFIMPQKGVAEPKVDKGSQKKPNDLLEQMGDPKQREQLLIANPEADLNKDGMLTLEEAWAFVKKDKAARGLLPVGTPAPDWTLKDAQGQIHRLSDYRGKVVVMDFWAVWCIPCLRAMPGLQKLHDELSKQGLIVLGLSTNEQGGDPVQLMKDRGYTYQLLLNGESISESYNVVGLPTIYVIGVDGRILHAGFGANEIAEQRRATMIKDYLNQTGK
jgi:peroxiredoxin